MEKKNFKNTILDKLEILGTWILIIVVAAVVLNGIWKLLSSIGDILFFGFG